ncbi:hypothetical protein JYA63_10115 [Fictibacillus nanhaiensis]|uniref:Uncharacterized protein n=1 Tax=Fictibacillus nanhaiensis TaxID=742169 RepID=A0ABS2ZP24_9BACL|nr:hypothetical protein [Fictibacillus nanhaiensis]
MDERQITSFYILPKGTNRPVGDTTPIAFRFLRFDPVSCCTFFETTIEQNTVTLQVAVDCHEKFVRTASCSL